MSASAGRQRPMRAVDDNNGMTHKRPRPHVPAHDVTWTRPLPCLQATRSTTARRTSPTTPRGKAVLRHSRARLITFRIKALFPTGARGRWSTCYRVIRWRVVRMRAANEWYTQVWCTDEYGAGSVHCAACLCSQVSARKCTGTHYTAPLLDLSPLTLSG